MHAGVTQRIEADLRRWADVGCSYDMLGEAALTAADAERYLHAYEASIRAIGRASGGRG
jgi:RHH-type proline utilization regulon transcriptional repressor/proline dehydrogenase/delta 1-pyrroline-5-carboxylate dehydrogenase